MNATELLDHALGRLEGVERERIEELVATDPTVATKLEHVRRRIDWLLDDGDDDALLPPGDLTARTVARVADAKSRWSIQEFVPVRVPFRWADVAVAATILVAGVMTLIPPLHHSKTRMDQAACAFNLRQLGVSLAQYVTSHRSFPYPDPDGPVPYAGATTLMLKEAGHLTDEKVLDCPSNGRRSERGPATAPAFDLETMCQREAANPLSMRHMFCSDYAFSLGYRKSPDDSPRPIPAVLTQRIPVISDIPAHDESTHTILEGNSPNHHFRGQNVLYTDGHVGWLHDRRVFGIADDDVFMNAARRAEPGLHARDAVLVPGCFRIDGK